MCAYLDKITTANRKWEKEVREGGMKSNVPWEVGAHMHTHQHKTRQVGSMVKGPIFCYIYLTSDAETTQITTAVCSKGLTLLNGV